MAKFSVTDAAFTGFRVVREHPQAVAIWAVVQLALSVLLTLVIGSTVGPTLKEFRRLVVERPGDPSVATQMVSQLGPFYLAGAVYLAVFYAVAWSAMNRAVLNPTDSRFGYLRLGVAELRQLAVVLLLTLALILAEIVGIVVFSILAVVGALLGKVVGAILSGVGFLGLMVWVAYVACRLSMASPLTFAEGRVRFFASWRMTKGHAWPMLGAYALATGLAIAVGLLGFIIEGAAAAAVGGGVSGLAEMLVNPDLGGVQAAFSPARLVMLVLGSGLMAALIPILAAPAPAIYRALTVRSEVADVF